jgi:hypothetical protein
MKFYRTSTFLPQTMADFHRPSASVIGLLINGLGADDLWAHGNQRPCYRLQRSRGRIGLLCCWDDADDTDGLAPWFLPPLRL